MSYQFTDYLSSDLHREISSLPVRNEAMLSINEQLAHRLRQLIECRKLLRVLLMRAWMRQDFHEADEIATVLGEMLPSDHEKAGAQ